MGKLDYFQRSLAAQFTTSRFTCPSCGSSAGSVVDRKFIVTQLRRCKNCQLQYRTPTDDPKVSLSFYESSYTQGFTTTVPSDAALQEMKRTGFAGTEKDYSYYINVLTQLGVKLGSKIFDYGCSWGYGSYQLMRAGFNVISFEVASTRKRYAIERLGISMVDDLDKVMANLVGTFDCFFSAHVLEHVPSPSLSFGYAISLLRPGGIFVSFTPNGCRAHRLVSPNWSKLWGEVHPNFIDDIFLNNSFAMSPRSIGSSPVTNASLPNRSELRLLNSLKGGELFFVAQKIGNSWR